MNTLLMILGMGEKGNVLSSSRVSVSVSSFVKFDSDSSLLVTVRSSQLCSGGGKFTYSLISDVVVVVSGPLFHSHS